MGKKQFQLGQTRGERGGGCKSIERRFTNGEKETIQEEILSQKKCFPQGRRKVGNLEQVVQAWKDSQREKRGVGIRRTRKFFGRICILKIAEGKKYCEVLSDRLKYAKRSVRGGVGKGGKNSKRGIKRKLWLRRGKVPTSQLGQLWGIKDIIPGGRPPGKGKNSFFGKRGKEGEEGKGGVREIDLREKVLLTREW